jgi:hypothetical protein
VIDKGARPITLGVHESEMLTQEETLIIGAKQRQEYARLKYDAAAGPALERFSPRVSSNAATFAVKRSA